jgi:dolichyl-diphosphooligosaccharide--protein glycosyltransferase
MGVCNLAARLVGLAAVVYSLWAIAGAAFGFRVHAIDKYGSVIHEFDPWFNFRATRYLVDNGWEAFFTWFDHRSWYPLGRPVATTIYPGMQVTAAGIYAALSSPAFVSRVGSYIGVSAGSVWTLEDVCCYMPAWFGVAASAFTGLLAYECSSTFTGQGSRYSRQFSVTAGVVSAGVMSVVPAHLQRSVGGGFDNECVAVAAMCGAFYFWCRALRSPCRNSPSVVINAVLAAACYAYMVRLSLPSSSPCYFSSFSSSSSRYFLF